MSSAEFQSTNPLTGDAGDTGEDDKVVKGRRHLFAISLHFDPYSATAQADYQRLQKEVGKFPILDILKSELAKTRINIALTRRLVRVLRFISQSELGDAVKTLIQNEDVLYPVYFNVLSAVKSVFSKLPDDVKGFVSQYVGKLIDAGHPVMAVDLNLQYAVRLLGELNTEEATAVLGKVFDETTSEPIRSDVILVMSKWNNWAWLSDRRRYFRSMSPAERRAFIVASFALADEGKHWRKHTAGEFSPLEQLTREWMSDRVNQAGWEIPI